ncbi:MAG: LysM peptidoglycan-binding domain-containing protein [Bacillota bacterium]|nr:LysM peptidoglycan-binding domain-containing protein [Bacillota bacterium]
MKHSSSHRGSSTYLVQPGDTLYLVARRLGVALSDLLSANPQVEDPSAITPGMNLEIPKASGATAAIRCLVMHPGTATPRAEGVVILDYRRGRISVLAHDLPAPSHMSSETYKVWMRSRTTGRYDVALLYPTPAGVWAAGLQTRSPLENYDGVLVTGESAYNDERPKGPIVVSAAMRHD